MPFYKIKKGTVARVSFAVIQEKAICVINAIGYFIPSVSLMTICLRNAHILPCGMVRETLISIHMVHKATLVTCTLISDNDIEDRG